jgi:VIT1/CCC1 family predicted Fe2+/Mn2+ transporter
MANFFLAKCPTCRSKLRVRSDYLGKRIMCNHCGHHGLATVSRSGEFPAYTGPPLGADPNAQVLAGGPISTLVAAPRQPGPVGPISTIDNRSPQGRVRELAEVLQRTREEVSAWNAEQTRAIQEIGESQHRIVEFRGQVQSLQDQLNRALEQIHESESARHVLEGERDRLNGLLSELEPLRGRAAEADLLAEEIQERDREKERLRTALGEFDRLLTARTSELDEERRHQEEIRARTEQEREADRAESERLRAEIEEARAAASELDRLFAARTLELDEARRHRDESRAETEEGRQAGRAEVERLRAEVEQARAAASRANRAAEVSAGELSAACDRLHELRTDLDARNAECAQLRHVAGKLEETRVDHELLLGEVEGYRSELRARDAERDRFRDVVTELDSVCAELRGRDAERERLGALTTELNSIRGDRERIDAERREEAVESERLRGRLVELERLLAEHDETRRRVEQEWEDLASLWSQERQELLDQAERQLGEERIRAKTELQGWQNRLNTASQHFARDLVALRKEIVDLNHELETLRQEQDENAVRTGVAAFELHRSATHPDEPVRLPRRREPVGPIEPDRFARGIEERRTETVESRPLRNTFDEVGHNDLDPEEPHRRTFPAWLLILGSLIVVGIGLLPFWLFEITWESYVVSSLLILVGVMVLGFFEGRYTGKNPILHALQMALVVGLIIAAVLLIGPRVLESTGLNLRLPGISKVK